MNRRSFFSRLLGSVVAAVALELPALMPKRSGLVKYTLVPQGDVTFTFGSDYQFYAYIEGNLELPAKLIVIK